MQRRLALAASVRARPDAPVPRRADGRHRPDPAQHVLGAVPRDRATRGARSASPRSTSARRRTATTSVCCPTVSCCMRRHTREPAPGGVRRRGRRHRAEPRRSEPAELEQLARLDGVLSRARTAVGAHAGAWWSRTPTPRSTRLDAALERAPAAGHRGAGARRRLRRGVRPGDRATPLVATASVRRRGEASASEHPRAGHEPPGRRTTRASAVAPSQAARLRQGTNLRASSGWATIVQALAFVRKELAEIVRQPRLLLLLVLGPFVLLLLFGAGLPRTTTIRLRTKFVGPQDRSTRKPIAEYADQLERLHRPRGFTRRRAGRRAGASRTVTLDAVVVFPPDALDQILAGESAEIDGPPRQDRPVPAGADRHRLAAGRPGGQRLGARRDRRAEPRPCSAPVDETVTCLSRARRRRCRRAWPTRRHGGDGQSAATVATTLGDARLVVATSQRRDRTTRRRRRSTAIGDLLARLESAEADADAISAGGGAGMPARRRGSADEITAVAGDDADGHRRRPGGARATIPRRTPRTSSGRRSSPPTTSPRRRIALLLQHLAVTFAALSLVRDRELGLFELLRVGPLSSVEILVGKTIAYLLVGLVVGAVLLAAAGDRARRAARRATSHGSVGAIALGAAGVAGARHGAVDDLGLRDPGGAVRDAHPARRHVLLRVLPRRRRSCATPYRYCHGCCRSPTGSDILQDVMLRGVDPARSDLIGLGVLVVAYGSLAVLLLHRRLRTE